MFSDAFVNDGSTTENDGCTALISLRTFMEANDAVLNFS